MRPTFWGYQIHLEWMPLDFTGWSAEVFYDAFITLLWKGEKQKVPYLTSKKYRRVAILGLKTEHREETEVLNDVCLGWNLRRRTCVFWGFQVSFSRVVFLAVLDLNLSIGYHWSLQHAATRFSCNLLSLLHQLSLPERHELLKKYQIQIRDFRWKWSCTTSKINKKLQPQKFGDL